jgi:hypothetical protein
MVRDRETMSKSELLPAESEKLNKQISYKGAYVGMTGDFKAAGNQSGGLLNMPRRDMSKSTVGQRQLGLATEMIDQIKEENSKQSGAGAANQSTKNRMTYMSKLGIGGE